MQSLLQVSIQLVSPASGDDVAEGIDLSQFSAVSIQLVSPASGDSRGFDHRDQPRRTSVVSIQLVSPASGDHPPPTPHHARWLCFHSIGVPSEWGHLLGTDALLS